MIATRASTRRGPATIGIDLGAPRLAAVQRAAGSRVAVSRAVEIPRRGLDLEGEIARLVRVLARHGFVSAPVVVGVPDAESTIAELSLPVATRGAPVGEIVVAQLSRIRQSQGGSIESVWWPTQPVDESRSGATRSLAAAVTTASAERISAAFDACGLPVDVIDLRPLALARAARGCLGDRLEVMIDLTLDRALVIVVERGVITYVRPIVVRAAPSARSGEATPLPLDAFVSELRLTLGYLMHRHPSETIGRLLLSGDESEVRSAAAAIAAGIQIPVEMLRASDLLRGAWGHPPAGGPASMVAAGLALHPLRATAGLDVRSRPHARTDVRVGA